MPLVSPNFLGLNVPGSSIAREPLSNRDHSKLFITSVDHHCQFFDLENYLHSGDLLVLNNTKVEPCRLLAHKIESKGKVELLFTAKESQYSGWAIYKSSHRLKVGMQLSCQSTILNVIRIKDRHVLIESSLPLEHLFQSSGHVPLPPYMNRVDTLADKQRYQSIWAKNEGSCAAPTASLHFTKRVIDSLSQKKVDIDYCTLHIGLGTFLPVKGNVNNHKMHEERFFVSEELKQKIQRVKARGNKVIAVGTSVARALESSISSVFRDSDRTSLFIKPGYKFQVIDRLITNFHQPDSTLILLVQAFSGKDNIKKYYREAFKRKYRLYSYGDAMLLENFS